MKKFKNIRFFKILSLIAAFAVFLPSCSSDDDSSSGETENSSGDNSGDGKTENEKKSSDNNTENSNNSTNDSKKDDTDTIITLKLTSTGEKYYNNAVYYAGVYKADTSEGELALCIGPSGNNEWFLYYKKHDSSWPAYQEYIYADNFPGKIENDELKINNTQTTYKVLDGTVNSDVTRYSKGVFDGEISKATIEVSGANCTLILKGNGTKKSVIDDISLEKSIFTISQITSGQTVSAKVSGSNLDIAESIVLQILGIYRFTIGEIEREIEREIEKEIEAEINANVTNSSEFSISIPLPEKPGEYKIKTSGTTFGKTANLKIFGNPLFTSFSIPKAGVTKAGNTVTATIKGENFTSPDVTSDSFTFTCDNSTVTSGTTVTIKDDNTLEATLTIPSDAGIYNVDISAGTNSISGEFEVKNYTDEVIGKIVLADGTLVDRKSYVTIDSENPPVAIVAFISDNGVPYMVGLQVDLSLWGSNFTYNQVTEFKEIECKPDNNNSAKTTTFTGDTDGSDNWQAVCKADPQGVSYPKSKYPAFYWANNYGETFKSILGGVTKGWYLPSIAELSYISRNIDKVSAAADVIYDLEDPSNHIYLSSKTRYNKGYDGYGYYTMYTFWSSSQPGNKKIWSISLSSGKLSSDFFNDSTVNGVLVIREL